MMASRIGDTYTLSMMGKQFNHGQMSELVDNEELKRKYLGIG